MEAEVWSTNPPERSGSAPAVSRPRLPGCIPDSLGDCRAVRFDVLDRVSWITTFNATTSTRWRHRPLSLNGNDASQSATLLYTNVLMKILKRSQRGAEALREVGCPPKPSASSLAEQGVLATLQMLKERLGDTGFNKFFEDQQAVLGTLTFVKGLPALDDALMLRRLTNADALITTTPSAGKLAVDVCRWRRRLCVTQTKMWAP